MPCTGKIMIFFFHQSWMHKHICFHRFFNDMMVGDNGINVQLLCLLKCFMCLDAVINGNDQAVSFLAAARTVSACRP
jgi:hypothetical protein